METLGAFEAKTHLSELLRRVEKGESFTITKNGTPVAKLVPIEETPRQDVKKVVEEILQFRKTRPLGNLTVAEIKELINEGRRM